MQSHNVSTRTILPGQSGNFHFIIDRDIYTSDVNYYDVLGVAKDANLSTIVKAFLATSRIFFQNNFLQDGTVKLLKLIRIAYDILSNDNLRELYDKSNAPLINPLLMRMSPAINNSTTFLDYSPIVNIPAERQIYLDEYVFDVNELALYAECNLSSLYYNPYIHQPDHREFSDTAKQTMKMHLTLRPYIIALENSLEEQAKKITPETVKALVTMLQKMNLSLHSQNHLENEYVTQACENARYEFLDFQETQLSKAQQKALDNYIIQVPVYLGGFARLKFFDAFHGSSNNCIWTTQIFCWQFVVMQDASIMSQVPADVIRKAERLMQMIKPPQDIHSNSMAEGERRQADDVEERWQPVRANIIEQHIVLIPTRQGVIEITISGTPDRIDAIQLIAAVFAARPTMLSRFGMFAPNHQGQDAWHRRNDDFEPNPRRFDF